MMPTLARRLRIGCQLAVAAATLVVGASPALEAQSPPQSSSSPPGWVFTPGISVAETWDNNVLLATEGSETVGDFLTAVTPRAALSFRGRRTTLQFDYRGSFQLYQQLSDLNAFDQRANSSFRQRMTPRLNLFARNSLSRSPSTDEIDLPGILFRREGVLIDDFRSGLEARLSSRTSLSGAYVFQWVNFDEDPTTPPPSFLDRSGYANGAEAQFDYVLRPRLTVGAEYDLRHATVGDFREFDIQNAMGTVDYQLGARYSL